MENILSNGFFWGIVGAIFVAVIGYISNHYPRTEEKTN